MLRVAFIVQRQWGFEIFKSIYHFQKVEKRFELKVLIVPQKSEFKIDSTFGKKVKIYKINPEDQDLIYGILKKSKIDAVFLYSWSHIIKEKIFKKFICLCLHPSPLPKYRGGTPIQNQLINGETESAVTVFRMNGEIDGGDIYQQAPISFLGNINDIFSEMVNLGTLITKKFITDYVNDELIFIPQKNYNKFPVYKRRKPRQSEIYFEKTSQMTFDEVNNLVRGLLDPYPNAFVGLNGGAILIREIIKHTKLPKNSLVINKSIKTRNIRKKNLLLKVKDGYAMITKYKIRKNKS